MLELGRGDKAAAVVQELVPVLYKLQAYSEAEHLLRWALGAVAEGKVPAAARGPLTEQLAETLFRSGQSAAAVPLYEDVVRTLEASGRRTACQLATALGNLALAYAVAGEPARAPPLLSRALAVTDERCPAGVPAAHMATASYHTVRSRHGRRADHIGEAHRLGFPSMHFDDALQYLGERDTARQALDRAIDAGRKHKDAAITAEAQLMRRELDRAPKNVPVPTPAA